MDNKQFTSQLAERLGADVKYAEGLINVFANVLCDRASNLDSVALPGFGNFVSAKQSEKIAVETSTGKRTLLPPQIKIEFVASAMLKKQVGQ